jgi:transcriptional regulator of aromatic amino acid metabolism
MKDAVLDAMEIPVFVMWHDGSIAMANRAARDLQPANDGSLESEDIVGQCTIWNEDFSRTLTPEEYPLTTLLRNQKVATPQRVGMFSSTGAKNVYDTCGEVIRDETTGEFIAGLVWLRDVTEYEEKLVTQQKTNELRFMTMCDSMPQLVSTYLLNLNLFPLFSLSRSSSSPLGQEKPLPAPSPEFLFAQ